MTLEHISADETHSERVTDQFPGGWVTVVLYRRSSQKYIITMVLLKVRHTGLIVPNQSLQFCDYLQDYSGRYSYRESVRVEAELLEKKSGGRNKRENSTTLVPMQAHFSTSFAY